MPPTKPLVPRRLVCLYQPHQSILDVLFCRYGSFADQALTTLSQVQAPRATTTHHASWYNLLDHAAEHVTKSKSCFESSTKNMQPDRDTAKGYIQNIQPPGKSYAPYDP